jgi:hypothetical protein
MAAQTGLYPGHQAACEEDIGCVQNELLKVLPMDSLWFFLTYACLTAN